MVYECCLPYRRQRSKLAPAGHHAPHPAYLHVLMGSGSWQGLQPKPQILSPRSCKQVMVDRKREAPAVFKHAGQYFMLTSGCQGWDPSASEVFVAR